MSKADELEKMGYPVYVGNWYNKAFYLIVSRKYDDAIAKIAASEKYIKNSKIDTYQANYYLAVCYQQKKQYQKSLDYAELALKNKVILVSFLNYELELYKLAADVSKKIGNLEKYNYYSKKYIEGIDKVSYQDKVEFTAALYHQDIITPLKEKLEEKNKNATLYIVILISVVILGATTMTLSIRKVKYNKKQFLSIIKQLEEKERRLELEKEVLPDILAKDNEAMLPKEEKEKLSNITEETENRILKNLILFEKKENFKNSNMTLGVLASRFNTNVNYLSIVIKKHKKTTFNNYINELRIDYIIKKLQSEQEYSNYKIAYLAEDCGFSSHNNFIRVFTQLKGMTPSKFLEQMKSYYKSN